MADPYSTLGVARSADEAAIKKAYRKLAKELHPDRNQDNPNAAARFSEVTGAYDLLTDKDKRAQYDRGEIDEQGNPKAPFGFGSAGGHGGFRATRGAPGGGEFDSGSADFSDIFEGLFGGARRQAAGAGGGFSGFGGRQRAPKGADVAYRLPVDFDDAAALKPQRITLSSGKTIDLKLTAEGVAGTAMRLAGQGEEGLGGRGDATVTIEVKPHRFYTRDGDDVRLNLPVRLDEALLGAKVKVPTVEGAVMLSVPGGSTSGKVLRLKGRGFHRRDGTRGDQLITLMIDVPNDDAELRTFVEGWTAERDRNPRAALGV
ncbi:DnaJ C-terminal domain-containing protein [Sphingomonas nostoxanthinifaciens]|uniref:DnaJ C-terminal domain-containing protein n=1 Tax=Sphingomonas nostoxanthinifaciens TaxID=2872652 RepID=UPI001CC20015|nr:DnaJ C-terminal domain-containing protein [Sphingomonas nostoxanthinifaciens]UAK24720.1 DnaJ domain-containing protein [Sphingomonas nostoxanthinifaciens]